MAVGAGLKSSLKSKVKVFAGRLKETGDGNRYESDETESDSEPFPRNRKDKKSSSDIRGINVKGRKSFGKQASKIKSFPVETKYSSDGNTLIATKRKNNDLKLSRRKNSIAKQRNFDYDYSNEEGRSHGRARSIRGQSRKIDARNFDYDYSDEEEGRSYGKARAMRGQSRKMDASGNKKSRVESSIEIDGTVSSNRHKGCNGGEASADKLRTRGKKTDGTISTSRDKGDAEDEVLRKHGKSEDKLNQIVEKKQVTFQTRVLDKSGKKIRTNRKASDDGSAESSAPPKKRKRVIKIDPYDISNKRLDDTIPKNEKVVEKKAEMSKNAQFRAIQPSPSILSYVEDNLLGRRRLNELRNAGYNIKLSAPLDNIPFSTSTERERIEESVFRNKLDFFAAAKISSSFPPPMSPEIAFAGRSNVGKSSLLNALTRQWGVVRTSDKPGHTQTINFFKLASKLCLVDLPGYGFAYAKDEVKETWEELVKEYVTTRVGLQRVCLLIDTKWGVKPRDRELIDLMEKSQTPYQIVLTKTDVVFPIDVARRAMQIQEDLKKNKLAVNPVMMASSKSGAGIRSLRTVLAKLARFIKP